MIDAENSYIKKFFKDETNERLAALVVGKVFGYQIAKHGIDGKEPDWIFDDKHKFEITLVCNKKKIEKIIQGKGFDSNDYISEFKKITIERIKAKTKKSYIDPNKRDVNLCLLLLPLKNFNFIEFTDAFYNSLFFELIEEIMTNDMDKYFKNIYLLMPYYHSWELVNILDKKIYEFYVGETFEDPKNFTITEIEL